MLLAPCQVTFCFDGFIFFEEGFDGGAYDACGEGSVFASHHLWVVGGVKFVIAGGVLGGHIVGVIVADFANSKCAGIFVHNGADFS